MSIMVSRGNLYAFLFYIYLIWSFIRFSFVSLDRNTVWIVPYIRPITYLIDPFLILLMFILFLGHSRVKKSIWLMVVGCFGLVMILTLSIVGNANIIQIPNVVRFIIGYFRFVVFLLFTAVLASYCDLDGILKKGLKLSILLLIISSFINILWFFKVEILKNHRAMIKGNQDWAYGLMENTNMFALSLVILFAFAVNRIVGQKRSLLDVTKYIALLVFCLIQLAWSESKVNIIGIIFSIIGAYAFIYGLKLNLKIIMVSIALLFGAFYFLQRTYADSSQIKALSNNKDIFLRIARGSIERNYKLRFIDDLIHAIPKEVNFSVLGAGPGTSASKFALDNPTEISSRYLVKYDKMNFENSGNSVLMSPRTGYTAIYGDLGVIAFFLYFSLYIYLLLRISKKSKKSEKYKEFCFVWTALTLNFLYNQVWVDSLYIGAPIFLIWTIGPMILISLDAESQKLESIS